MEWDGTVHFKLGVVMDESQHLVVDMELPAGTCIFVCLFSQLAAVNY